MRMVDLIRTKRDGGELTPEEMSFFIDGLTKGTLPDHQISALLMAIFFAGFSDQEQFEFTDTLMKLTPPLDLSSIPGPKIGKHSTGGVGDKTSMVAGALVASAGVNVPMIVGRGLGHTGGTLDKMESIPGFKTQMSAQEFQASLGSVHFAMMAPTEAFLPADKKLYSMRNDSATVESIPLIVGSLLSKKFAEGTDGVVLDVKTGAGALTAKITDARQLAHSMVTVGKRLGKNVIALISDMEQPLGNAIGHALEIMETVQTLRGDGPEDLEELSLEIASRMMVMAKPDLTLEAAKDQMFKALNEGAGLQKFRELVAAQGGNADAIDNFELLPNATADHAITSPRTGYISKISADGIGLAVALLGGRRDNPEAALDAAVGIVLEHKTGDHIQAGEPLCTIYHNQDSNLEEAIETIEEAFRISATPPETRPLVYEVIQ